MIRRLAAVLTVLLVLTAAGCSSGDRPEALAAADSTTVATATATASTTTTTPPIDLDELANVFRTDCRRLSDEADPGDVYLLGDMATAQGESITFDLNKRSTRLCLDITIALLTDTFGFPASIDSRISGTRALDGELTADTADGAWRAYWRNSKGLKLTVEAAG